MNNIDKEIVIEDLAFIADYISQMLKDHPEIMIENPDVIKKIDRRMNDIIRRVES